MQNSGLWYREFGAPSQVLRLETHDLPVLKAGQMRVQMISTPVNPSDLIPVTGAYSHRITPPVIAGYEGVGRVVVAPAGSGFTIGDRVLPVRGVGTWQSFVDCDPALAIPVPDDVPDDLATRAYINPLAAFHMLDRWPVKGKTVILSGAGSACAGIMGQWALAAGANKVFGVYRSPSRRDPLERIGVTPVSDKDQLQDIAKSADLFFDAVGGALAGQILAHMPAGSDFVGYGLLSGRAIPAPPSPTATLHRFHLRDTLNAQTADRWQSNFKQVWRMLADTQLPSVQHVSITDWRRALSDFETPGRDFKPVLIF